MTKFAMLPPYIAYGFLMGAVNFAFSGPTRRFFMGDVCDRRFTKNGHQRFARSGRAATTSFQGRQSPTFHGKVVKITSCSAFWAKFSRAVFSRSGGARFSQDIK
eukprot:GEMP01019723.1.p3 GENE.GEMP01019723.1~~GEMP01019723.1.p3  ORF type:complete len:104 (+),score=11.15 GEMP01019723.1:867-1178(+)